MGYSIRTKLLGMVGFAFLIAMVGVVGLTVYFSAGITREVVNVVDTGQVEVYSQRLNGITSEIGQAERSLQATLANTGLAGTDMAKTYEADAQVGIVSALTKQYYEGKSLGKADAFPFIVDSQASVIMHPAFKKGDDTLQKQRFADMMKEAKAGVFKYQQDEVTEWVFLKKFEPWGWTVCYVVPEGLKYAGVEKVKGLFTSMRNQLAAVIIALAVLVLLGLAWFVSSFVTVPLVNLLDGLRDVAEQVSAASAEVASSSQSLAEGASEQAASIEETSASIEEMASMTKQNADSANQADILMTETTTFIEEAKRSVSELNGSMRETSIASEEAAKIVRTIDEIAFQTNLLALNAAVEAARAGEAGAGFAVVADEVRNLAMRAAEAAKVTASLIEGTVRKIKSGSDIVAKTNETFSKVEGAAKKVGTLVGEISAASNEQAQGVDQINKAMGEMDRVVQKNAANAEESASAAEEMSAQAEQVNGYVGDFMSVIVGNANGAGDRGNGGGVSRTLAAARKEPALPERTTGRQLAIRGRAPGKVIHPEQVIPMNDGDFKDF